MTNNFFIWLWHSGNWRTDAITCDPNNVLLYVNTLTQSAVIISFTKIITNILCMYLIQFVFLFGCNCTILFSIWFPFIGSFIIPLDRLIWSLCWSYVLCWPVWTAKALPIVDVSAWQSHSLPLKMICDFSRRWPAKRDIHYKLHDIYYIHTFH